MKSLKIFFSIYGARLGKDFSLPLTNQLFQLVGSVCYFYLHLYAFQLIINRVTFPGWSKAELMVLLFTFEIFTYLAFFLFWKGLNHTVRDIATGAFDVILAKPVSSRLITFFRGGGQHNLYCAFLGLVYLIIYFISGGFHLTILGGLGFIVALFTSLWATYCFSVVFISLNFCYGNLPATVGVMYQVQEIYKYPATIFSQLFLIVLALFTTVPAAMLLLKPLRFDLILIFIVSAILSTIAAHFSWSSGLRHYSSAS